VVDRTVSVPMILSDLRPGFQGHDIFLSRVSEKGVFWDKVTIEH